MFNSISNWISTNLQVLTDQTQNKEQSSQQEEKTEGASTVSNNDTLQSPAQGAEDVDKIEKVDVSSGKDQQKQEASGEGGAAAPVASVEEDSKIKIFDSIKNDFNKILSIDKQEALEEAKEFGS